MCYNELNAKPKGASLMAKSRQNNGRNRAERRAGFQQEQKPRSDKPLGLRIAVLVLLGIMFIGFFLMPLLK